MRISDWSSDVCSSDLHVSGTKRHLCLGSLSGAPQGLGAPDPLAGRAHCLPQVSAPLHVEPEVGAVAEHPRENEGCRSRELAAGVAQLVHMIALHPHRLRQRPLRQAQGPPELLHQERSEERRAGPVSVSTCKLWCAPYLSQNTTSLNGHKNSNK